MKRGGKVWRRLRVVEVQRRTDREELLSLAKLIETNEALDTWVRQTTAGYLHRLADNPAALKALSLTTPGRPRSQDTHDIALDYAVCRELFGKAAAALAAVAKAWNVSEATVKAARTECDASGYLAHLVDGHVGKLRVGRHEPDGTYVEHLWTRREVLEAIRADLQDQRKARNAGLRK